MAYNYFGTGSQIIGDLIAVVDPQLNTKIDFSEDQIDLVTSGSTVLSATKVGVSVTGSFNVSGGSFTGTTVSGTTAQFTTISGSTITGSNVTLAGGINIAGVSVVGKMSERITISSAGSGSVTFDTINDSIFYNNGPTANITANFTNMSTTSNRATSVTVILSQSATPRIISAVQINTTSSTINWANNVIPTGNANKHDIFGFSLIRSGSTWVTLGQMSTYG